jgi:MFS family permease
MSDKDRPQIEAEPGTGYRRVFNGPLGRPRELILGTLFFAVASVFTAWLASWQGGFWWALLPIFPAIWIGIGIAGLMPEQFFKDENKPN